MLGDVNRFLKRKIIKTSKFERLFELLGSFRVNTFEGGVLLTNLGVLTELKRTGSYCTTLDLPCSTIYIPNTTAALLGSILFTFQILLVSKKNSF